MKAEDVVVNLIKLNDRELIGRTRLQKEAYLLDRCGAEFGLSFTYYYYGPYSFELADGWEDARAEGRIEISEEPGRYGVPYSIFKLKRSGGAPDSLGNMSADAARARLRYQSEDGECFGHCSRARRHHRLSERRRLRRADHRRIENSQTSQGDGPADRKSHRSVGRPRIAACRCRGFCRPAHSLRRTFIKFASRLQGRDLHRAEKGQNVS